MNNNNKSRITKKTHIQCFQIKVETNTCFSARRNINNTTAYIIPRNLVMPEYFTIKLDC